MRSPPIRRRTLLSGMLAAAIAGCVGEPRPTDTDEEERVPPELQLDDVALDHSFPVELYDPETGEKVSDAQWHGDRERSHWHRLPLEVPAGADVTVRVQVNDADIQPLPLGPDEAFHLQATVEEGKEDVLSADVSGDLLTLHGGEPGEAVLIIEVRSDGEDRWAAPELPITVTES